MLKDQLFKTSELQFDNCLFEPETGSRSITWVMDPTNLLSRDTTCQGLQEIKITIIFVLLVINVFIILSLSKGPRVSQGQAMTKSVI